ncbi:hypothetical protein A3D84_03270 [Candidatus Woesebacteria bacterium RIFCSPHIGHO2_02_FULL_42_20]|uniref:Undecaprenyl-diphosphatase n=1 Tax=Candidatus Woesebacteria bacterium RIFCSPHIGHO2_12_FULL_41_24 TaxID=1802510 RepID=A0A1F8AS14_9BACT|nr:MAG: hypothetical protein A2W15_03460 [Candidatus Woesebacteria bacterium RBG_16_41_13]OGM28929.1 MAG: hypothetical protein A2873_01650 [Candidatus Woesebacteria bacterium RIFCSPHIGHO2_01_FULL_42_80]OGM34862.1 MAG: hypothetical protein A3D84_03270 [Candidatus Woesebacteria bacterium RIFCSPHIGHO2_02_FULL_42_20]OGM54491.1 MAG: hypothetical protein A3E44_00305 [Candidatus Woesebacteria bacterium RIFCSPHIGHO2_12_FULL_41_24]OGM65735.1 MAG: hypothetical protein A2969_00705 [Candidatus Woesebacteri
MDIGYALLLGAIQGLTEFLPISSSGHLVLAKKFFPEMSYPGVWFEVILHLGTLVAVFIYFRKKILKLNLKWVVLLLIGSIPAGFAGIFFREVLEETFFRFGIFLGIQFLITSAICFIVDKLKKKNKVINMTDAFLIGLGQAVAILPAISRSGSTIFVAVLRGIDKRKAAEFSFLLSIPAIVGANLVEVLNYKENIRAFDLSYLIGFLTAFVVGFFSIGWTINLLTKKKFGVFGIYTFILAILTIVF